MSKSPKLSNVQVSQILKAQVTQSSSHPKSKLPKLPRVQVTPKYSKLSIKRTGRLSS